MEHPVPIERLLRHREWLAALAHRLAAPSGGEDLEQETWLAALRNPPDSRRPAKPWLAAVTRRIAGRSRAKEAQRNAVDQEGSRAESLPDTAELIERIDTEKRLATEVQQLAEPYRTIVLLRYYDGLTSAEIASRQGVPAGTVRRQLKEGLDQLRQRLDRAFGGRELWSATLLSLAQATDVPAKSVATTSSAGVGVLILGAAIAAAVSIKSLGQPARNGDPSLELASTGPSPSSPTPAPQPAAVLATPASERAAVESRSSAAPQSDARICVVRGRLVDEAGEPVAGANVACRGWVANQRRERVYGMPKDWQNPDPVVSGEDGTFRFSFEPPAAFQFIVDVDHELYGKIGFRWSELEPGQTVDLGDAVLETPGIIRGTVVNGAGEPLIEGWKVTADPLVSAPRPRVARQSHEQIDLESGLFEIANLPPGPVTLTANGPRGRETNTVFVTTTAGEVSRVDLICEQPEQGATLQLSIRTQPFTSLSPELEAVTATGPDGTLYELSRIPRRVSTWRALVPEHGPYQVEINDPRFETWRKEVRVGEYERADLIGSSTLLVTVREHSGDAVPEFDLRLHPDGISNSTSEIFLKRDGVAPEGTIFRVVPGELTLEVRALDYAPQQVYATAAPNETKRVIVSLPDPEERCILAGRVMHANGQAARGVRVQLTRGTIPGHDFSPGQRRLVHYEVEGVRQSAKVGFRDAETTTNADGAFSFGPLDPGPYTVRAIANDWVQVDRRTSCNSTEELLLRLPGFGTVEIAVSLPESVDPKSCVIGLNVPDQPKHARDVRLDPSGMCRIDNVPVGRWRASMMQEIRRGDMSMHTAHVQLGELEIEANSVAQVSFDPREILPMKGTIELTVNGSVPDESVKLSVRAADATTENLRSGHMVGRYYGEAFGLLPPGRWQLYAVGNDGWIWSHPEILEVLPGQPFVSRCEVILVPRVARVVHEGGSPADTTPISWETVTRFVDPWKHRRASPAQVTDAGGSLGTLDLPPGRYAFWPTDDPSRRVEIDWPTDDTEPIEIVLPPPGEER